MLVVQQQRNSNVGIIAKRNFEIGESSRKNSMKNKEKHIVTIEKSYKKNSKKYGEKPKMAEIVKRHDEIVIKQDKTIARKEMEKKKLQKK